MRTTVAIMVVLLAATMGLSAQSISPQVIASSGGDGNIGDVYVSWTLGEFAVTTINNSTNYITQGFHQPAEGTSDVPRNQQEIAGIGFYPNPVHNELHIQLNEHARTALNATITDIIGATILQADITAGQSEVRMDMSTLPSGTYIVRVATTEGVATHIVTRQQ